MATTSRFDSPAAEHRPALFGKRLDEIGWGLFLLMTGVLWLLPSDAVPTGSWLIGTGVLLLGMNAVRYATGSGIGVFTVVLGLLALSGGIAERSGVTLPLLAIAIAVTGVALLVKAFTRTDKTAG